ncbi:hypothetical protein [Kitasatospora aureofaciens]|uniref:hypothetical protein n=1 Tax=Kitasatospora aureofaciens TaxID=1894 RepID=UPI0038057102
MPTNPLWEPTLAYSETDLRSMDSMLVMTDGTALGSRPGIRPGDPGLTVTLSGATVNVSAGVATLSRAGQGLYRAYLAATSPGTLAAAHATYTRVDLVYLRVWDTAVDATGLRKADAVYLTGTASATPVSPSPGATEIYIPLATITVPPSGGGSPTVSSAVRQLTVAPGGILPVSSTTDIALAGNYVGQARHNTVRNVPEFWTGSAWAAQGDWQSYTPTWTALTTNPSIGNGTLVSRWSRIGQTIHWMGSLTAGSTTSGGSGLWSMSLPAMAANTGVTQLGVANYVNIFDNEYMGQVEISPGSATAGFSVKNKVTYIFTNVSDSSPVTTSSSVRLHWNITYEAA